MIYRLMLSLLLALQLSLASAVPSHAHVSGELAGGKVSIKSIQSAIKSKIDNIAQNRGVGLDRLPCCFVAGTPVKTISGYKNIEELVVGDEVLSQNVETGAIASGVFRNAENTRQFRIDSSSLAGNHAPNVPHLHLETVGENGRTLTTNNHIPLVD